MKILQYLKRHILIAIAVLAYVLVGLLAPAQILPALKTSGKYLLEMLFVMPVVFMLTMLIEVWISREGIIKHLGEGSGLKGAGLSIALGSLSAGPIYAAFPICRILLSKGLSVANLVIILSAWAVIKVPMLAMETRFLGPGFMALRWVLTVSAIIIMGFVIGLLVKRHEIPVEQDLSNSEASVTIDQCRCTACGVCVRAAPEWFIKNGETVQVHPDKESSLLPEEERAPLLRLCPFGAIG
ncbi:MAG: permease [Spirochaetes bacterium]|nr:permease [Spirochaetota bacterium]